MSESAELLACELAAYADAASRSPGRGIPAPCGAAGPAALALSQRMHGTPPATTPGKKTRPAVGPEILRRVLDGLKQL